MADESQQEKTEDPTPKKREEARKNGQVAKSMDLNTAFSIIAALLALGSVGPMLTKAWIETMQVVYRELHVTQLDPEWLMKCISQELHSVWIAALILMLIVLAFGVGISVIQVGWHISEKAMEPKWQQLNPIEGFKRLFSSQAVANFLGGILKISAVTLITYPFLHELSPYFPAMIRLKIAEILPYFGELILSMGWRIALAMLAIGAIDYLFQWWRNEQKLKMSKQEIKDEMKQQEGDPQVKQHIRSLQRQRAMKRMMDDVPKATVVITNPTHVAVALRYEPGMPAPLVLAKGKNLIAERIKKLAREHEIPVYEEPPLARALLKQCEIGTFIPEMFYRAVAQIMAVVMRNKTFGGHQLAPQGLPTPADIGPRQNPRKSRNETRNS